MKQLGELLIFATDFLKEKEVDHPRRVVEELLGHVLGMKRLDLYVNSERPVEEGHSSLNKGFIHKFFITHRKILYCIDKLQSNYNYYYTSRNERLEEI